MAAKSLIPLFEPDLAEEEPSGVSGQPSSLRFSQGICGMLEQPEWHECGPAGRRLPVLVLKAAGILRQSRWEMLGQSRVVLRGRSD